jgi:hypothetical protein
VKVSEIIKYTRHTYTCGKIFVGWDLRYGGAFCCVWFGE